MNSENSQSPDPEPPDPEELNLNGQRIGRKGQRTKQRLVDAVVGVLKTTSLRDVSVAELARKAETSPATFYVYFAGVPELVLEALKMAPHYDKKLLRIAAEDWSIDPDTAAKRFVDRYFELWQRHRSLYMVRNLAAEEGDPRFVEARLNSARPILRSLAKNVRRSKKRGFIKTDVSDYAVAAAIVTMIERISAVAPVLPEESEVSVGEIKAAAIFAATRILGY